MEGGTHAVDGVIRISGNLLLRGLEGLDDGAEGGGVAEAGELDCEVGGDGVPLPRC